MSKYRGHEIKFKDGKAFYCDTGEPTVDNPRPCGTCSIPNRSDGHDACIGELPGVINACCGHGEYSSEYVQFEDGTELRGVEALRFFNTMNRRKEI
jgi:hypothetical protein